MKQKAHSTHLQNSATQIQSFKHCKSARPNRTFCHDGNIYFSALSNIVTTCYCGYEVLEMGNYRIGFLILIEYG